MPDDQDAFLFQLSQRFAHRGAADPVQGAQFPLRLDPDRIVRMAQQFIVGLLLDCRIEITVHLENHLDVYQCLPLLIIMDFSVLSIGICKKNDFFRENGSVR